MESPCLFTANGTEPLQGRLGLFWNSSSQSQ